jgi:pyrroline-5-carboxylate reductase
MKIGNIGFGNLGHSLAEGLNKSGTASGKTSASATSPPRSGNAVTGQYGLTATDDVNMAIGASEVIFLVVKSYAFEELAPAVDRSLSVAKPSSASWPACPLRKLLG